MNTVRAYADNAEHAILRTYLEHGVLAASYGCKQGPHTLTFALRLVQNVQPQLEKALKLGALIEGAIRDGPVRVRHKSGYIYVEIPSPAPVAVQAQHLRGEGLAVPLGITTVRAVRGVDFANPATAHLVIVAGTGRGKTTAARTLLYGLARQNEPETVRLAVCTFKPPDWEAFEGLPHVVAVATLPRRITDMLRWARAEVYRRSQLGVMSPRYVLVLDDMYNWGKVVDVGAEIGEIASLGRASGIHLVISTQKMTSEGVGNNAAAIANISTRLILGATSAAEAAQVTGITGSGAERLGRYPGDALLLAAGAPVRLACAHVSDDTVRALLAGRTPVPAAPAPWADLAGGATNAPGAGQESALSLDTVSSDAQAAPSPAALLTTTAVSPDTVSSDAQTGQPSGRPSLPLERIDPPTAEQVQEIVRVFGEMGRSLNKTVTACYGAKGARTLHLVHQALRLAGVQWEGEGE